MIRFKRICGAVCSFWGGSIRRQLALAFGTVSLLMMLAYSLLLVNHQRQFLYGVTAERATALAQALSASSASWVLANDVAGLQEVLQGFAATPDLKRAFVLSPQGEVMGSTNRADIGRYVSDAISRGLLASTAETHLLVAQADMVDVAVPVLSGERLVGWARVELSQSSANANLRQVTMVGWGFVLLALLTSLVVAMLLAARLTRSLHHLMRVVAEVEAGRRDVRASLGGTGELAMLGRHLNAMLDAQHTSEEHLARLSRLYAILSRCNDAIVRQDSAGLLFRAVCHIITEQLAGCRTAVALVGGADGWMNVIAQSGFRESSVQRYRISTREDVPEGRGAVGMAVRSGKPVVLNDFLSHDSTTPWHELAKDEGVNAIAVFPLKEGADVVGVLSVYATNTGFFDGEIVDLMQELAQNLSFALENFSRERQRLESEISLRRSESRLRQAQTIGRIGYWEIDLKTRGMEWSEETFRLYERPLSTSPPLLDEILPMMVGDDRERLAALMADADQITETISIDYGIRLPSGRMAYHHATITPVLDERAHVVRLKGTVQDITERKLAEEKLAQAAKVFDSTSEGIMITDAEGNIISINWAFQVITGYSEAEALGKNPRFLASGRQDAEFYRKMWASINMKGGWQGEIWNRRHSGEIYPEWLTISAVRDASGRLTNYVGIFTDISERKAVEERMQHLAHHDALTDLPNRVLMMDRLEQALVRAQRRQGTVAVLFLDIDHFKTVNDTLGHDVGDLLLQEVARRLLNCVREQDTVSRLGGDEFVVILPETDATGAGLVAQKVIEEISQPMQLHGRTVQVTTSVGISLFPEDTSDIDTLIKNADTAMYDAKESGRGTYKYYEAEKAPQSGNAGG